MSILIFISETKPTFFSLPTGEGWGGAPFLVLIFSAVSQGSKKYCIFATEIKKTKMMKKQLLFVVAALCFCSTACKKEKIAIAGSGWQEIAIIDKKTGSIEWKHELDKDYECNDIEVTPEGNVLFAYLKGARLINKNHEIIWDYKAKENEEIHSATRLGDGGYMIAVCGEPARIVELDNNGNVKKEIPFMTLIFDSGSQFRQIAKAENGTYYVPLIEKQKVLQISPDGRISNTFFMGKDLFSVKVLKNNNILISCGRDGGFVEVDPETKSAYDMLPTNIIKGGSLLYVAEIIPYENGNKLIANSNMRSNDKSQPLVIEINKNNDIIWSLPYNKEIKNITSIFSFFE